MVAIRKLIFFTYLCNVMQDSILLSAKITLIVLKIVNMSKESINGKLIYQTF